MLPQGTNNTQGFSCERVFKLETIKEDPNSVKATKGDLVPLSAFLNPYFIILFMYSGSDLPSKYLVLGASEPFSILNFLKNPSFEISECIMDDTFPSQAVEYTVFSKNQLLIKLTSMLFSTREFSVLGIFLKEDTLML